MLCDGNGVSVVIDLSIFFFRNVPTKPTNLTNLTNLQT